MIKLTWKPCQCFLLIIIIIIKKFVNMKSLQTQQQKEFENLTRYCIYSILVIILLLITITLGTTFVLHIVCVYDSNSKYRNIILSNNQTNYMNICFNSSNPLSYNSQIRQLDQLFDKYYCYDVNLNFELQCTEKSLYNFSHPFTITSSQLIKYHNYCLKNYDGDYGYRKSQPCIVFVYFNKHLDYKQSFYKFPISVSIKQNFRKWINCNLVYNNSQTLTLFQLTIKNGHCP